MTFFKIMNDVIDNFGTVKITIETSDGCLITSLMCPILCKMENEMIYIYDDKMNETIIKCKSLEILNDVVIDYEDNYTITLEWSF